MNRQKYQRELIIIQIYYRLKIYIIYPFIHKYFEIEKNYVKNAYSIYFAFDFATMLIIIVDLAKNCYKYQGCYCLTFIFVKIFYH